MIYTIADIAEALRISRRRACQLCKNKVIPATLVGGSYCLEDLTWSLLRALQRNKRPGPRPRKQAYDPEKRV